jgi:hypothetical protein
VRKVPAVDQNRYHLSIASLAQFRAKFGTSKFFLFVFGQKTKSQLELRNGPVPRGTSGTFQGTDYIRPYAVRVSFAIRREFCFFVLNAAFYYSQ